MHKRVLTVEEALEEMGTIHLNHLTNPIHREFVKDTLMAAKASEGVMANLSVQVAALETAYNEELDTSVIVDTIQRLTQEIYELASERSLGQTTLKSALRGVMGTPGDPEKAAKAAALFELMHKYDLHSGMNVDEQTAVIDSFIRDVEENYAEDMESVGMSVLYNQLKEQNEAVCQKVYERDDARVGIGTGRMEAARTATDKAWRNLRNGVNFLASTDAEPYAHFIGHMNELIIRYKRVHLGQTTSSPEAEPGETTPGEGGEQQPGEGEQQPTTPTNPTTPTKYTVTFTANGSTVATQQYEAGEVIQAPEAPSGYEWEEFPYRMPANDITVNAVRRNIPGGGGGSGFE